MSKLSGGVLILAGLAIGAYALWPQHRPGTPLAAAQNAQRAAVGQAPRGQPATRPTTRPATRPATRPVAPPVTSPAARPQPAAAKAPAAPVEAPAVRPPPAAAAPPPVTAVTIDEVPSRVPVGKAQSAAPPPLDEAALTREIQGHLARIGCYRDAVDGIWGPATRRAMQAFTARANAKLPVDGPDPVLLAMVQSYKGEACGACPPGQDRAADGRCLPAALMAHAGPSAKDAKRRHAASDASPASGTKAGTAARRRTQGTAAYRPMPGRMSLAGPRARRSARTPDRATRRRAIRHRHMRARARSRAAYARARQRHAPRRRTYSGITGFPAWVPLLPLP